ncbi:hypothetical protein GOODEAATRI_008531 [Goodea atripinnis]|uniref:Kinesin motor domain-containing protein n=1 Tax=Goodea atripinnis TaxID=208336 RepID=A0ABV0N004_9TELE
MEEDIESEVVMVRLGGHDGGMDPDTAQRSPYMELKPSTTLLVPFEFMEGQQDLVDGAHFALPELQPSVVGDEQQPETHTGFTLMLDTDEDGVTEALAAGNDLQMSELLAQPQIQSENLLDKCDVITLDTDNIEEAAQEEERKEIENLDQNDVYVVGEEEPGNDQADLQTEFTAAKQDDSAEQKDLKLEEIRIFSEDEESAAVSVPGEPLAADTDSTAKTEAVEEEVSEEDKTMPAEEVQLPEGNGSVDTEMEKTESAVEDKKHDHITSSETEARSEEETEEKPRRILRHRNVKEELGEQVVSSDSQTEKQTVASHRKKAPSTPTRRMTRGRNVTFISPLPEAADEREQDGNAEFDKQSIAVPATATRTSRKGKPLQTATPRRSTRKTQPELSKEEAEGMDNEISLASTSKTPSPGRRSQRATATRTSIKDKSLTTEVEIKEDSQEDEVVKTTRSRRTSSKTPTPSKRSTTQTGTPRRSSRKTVNTSEVEPTPLEAVKEENKEVPVVPPVKRSSRKMRPEVLPAVFEEDEKKQQLSSPGRTTRQFSLNVYPQVERTRKKSTKPSVEQVSCQPPVTDVVAEPAENESIPEGHSFIYSPSRQRQTRADLSASLSPVWISCTMRAKASDMHTKDSVKVAVRVRPFNKVSVLSFFVSRYVQICLFLEILYKYKHPPTLSFSPSTKQRERDAGSRCIISLVSTSISIQDPRDCHNRRSFCFDYAYWSHGGFTRDHTGLFVPEEPGGRYADQVSSKVFFSMLEIYNEQVEQLMEQGTRTRTTAATQMNANSSRSHMLIILQLKQERRMMQMYPYILNINEDAQLSGVVKLFIQEGDWGIGLCDSSPRSISIKGLGIQERHAVFRNEQRRVTLTPVMGSKVIVNGNTVYETIELQHLVWMWSKAKFINRKFLMEEVPLGEDDILIDPSEVLGRRLDFQLVLDQCCGVCWIKEARNRGIQIGVFDCSEPLYTPAVWHNINPLLDHRVQFTSLQTSQSLLDYLQSSAVVLELWGLQGEEGNIRIQYCTVFP